jgi:aspartate/methionine/tyrosine aminotransferase
MTGLPALREQLVAKIAASYGHHYDAGGDHHHRQRQRPVLRHHRLVHPGDEVIMFEPAFDGYRPIDPACRAAPPVVIALQAPGFRHSLGRGGRSTPLHP